MGSDNRWLRLMKCKKCGATICTDEAFVERALDKINYLAAETVRDHRNKTIYLGQISTIKSIVKQYLHQTAQMDTDNRRLKNELNVLVHYVLDNNLVSQEKMNELNAIARKKAAINEEIASQEVERLYGQFENMFADKARKDPTERKVVK